MTSSFDTGASASTPSKTRILIGVVAGGALVGAQYGIRSDPESMIATIAFLIAAAVLAAILPTPPLPAIRPASIHRWSRAASIASVACVVIAAAVMAAATYLLTTEWNVWFYPGWALLIAATALASFGLSRMDRALPASPSWSRREIGLLLLILVAGTWLRAHRLGDFPDGYTTHAIEEQQTGLGGYRVVHDGVRQWEFALDYQMTALAIAFDPQPNFTTIRVPYVIVSALTVLPVHLLLRLLFTTPAALAGTFLYAMMSWNLLYARCAHPIFPTNLLVIATFAALISFGRTRRLWTIPWVGLFCGYTLYSYAGFRGTPLFALIFLGGVALAALRPRAQAQAQVGDDTTRGQRLARPIAAIAIFAAFLGATAIPLTSHLRGGGNYYFEAADRALANKQYYTDDTNAFIAQRVQRLRELGAIFMHFGDGSPTFNYPGEPMLDPVSACLATVGTLLMLLRLRRGYNAYLLLVAAILLIVGTVFVQNLDVRRLQGITIFVALAAATTVEQVWFALAPYRSTRRLVLLVGMVAAVAISGFSYHLYFVRMANDPAIRRAFKDYYTTMIRFGQEQAHGRTIRLASIMHRFFDRNYHYRYNYSWLIDPVLQGSTLSDLTDLLQPSPRDIVNTTVVVQRPFEAEASAALLQLVYPGTVCRPFIEADNPWVGLSACDLPDHSKPLALESTLKARYWNGSSPDGPATVERSEPFIGYVMVPPECYVPRANEFCHVQWQGELSVGADGDHHLVVEQMGHTLVSAKIDGVIQEKWPMLLAPGVHQLEITATLPKDWETGVQVSWIQGGEKTVLPFYRLADH